MFQCRGDLDAPLVHGGPEWALVIPPAHRYPSFLGSFKKEQHMLIQLRIVATP